MPRNAAEERSHSLKGLCVRHCVTPCLPRDSQGNIPLVERNDPGTYLNV